MFTKRFKIITVFLTAAIIASIVAACGKDVIETTGHDVENVSEEVQKVIEEYREETGKDPTEEEVRAILSDKIEHVHNENCNHDEVTSESVNEEEEVTSESVNNETPKVETITQPGGAAQKPATNHVVTNDSSETEVSSSSSVNKENESSKPSVTPKPVDTKPTEKPSDSGSSSKPETHTHSYGAWVTTKNATCASEGKQERTCSCGKKETKSIAKTSNHTWNSGSVTKEATTTSTGVKTYTCTVCGTTKAETIPKKTATPTPAVHTHNYNVPAYKTVNHPAEYKTVTTPEKRVYHEAEYKTVHHDAVYNTVEEYAERTVWWLTYSDYTSDQRKWSDPSTHHTVKFYTESEWVSNGNYYTSQKTLVTQGFYGETYCTGTKQVLVSAAWDEQVLVKEAWYETIPAKTEKVKVKDAWSEQVVDYYACSCGQKKP